MLSDKSIMVSIPAQDQQRAKRFYAEKLGLQPYIESGFGIYYETGGSRFAIIRSEDAGKATYSLITWHVSDIRAEMAALRARGVEFIEYDQPGLKTVDGIFTIFSDQIAWFKDSEGNTLSLAQID